MATPDYNYIPVGGGEGLENWRLVPCVGIPARPIRLQDFATSRKSPPLFGRVAHACTGEAGEKRRLCRAALEKRHCRTGEQSLSLLQPHSLVRLVAEFRVTVSVCRRSKSGSPSCQSQHHGRGSPGQRLSLKPLLDYIYPDSGHRLKLSLYTRLSQSGSSLVSGRFCHWQN